MKVLPATSDFYAICSLQTCDNGPPEETKLQCRIGGREPVTSTEEFACVPGSLRVLNAVMSDNPEERGGEMRPRCG